MKLTPGVFWFEIKYSILFLLFLALLQYKILKEFGKKEDLLFRKITLIEIEKL